MARGKGKNKYMSNDSDTEKEGEGTWMGDPQVESGGSDAGLVMSGSTEKGGEGTWLGDSQVESGGSDVGLVMSGRLRRKVRARGCGAPQVEVVAVTQEALRRLSACPEGQAALQALDASKRPFLGIFEGKVAPRVPSAGATVSEASPSELDHDELWEVGVFSACLEYKAWGFDITNLLCVIL